MNESARWGHRALPGERGLHALLRRQKAVVGTVNPRPIFMALTQFPSHRIRKNVGGLFLQLMMVTQSMVEEISLPYYAVLTGQELLPLRYGCLQARFPRHSQDGM